MKITPQRIRKLNPNEVFVFGSNRAGRHGRGAAKQALKWGAKMGQGEGLMGQTYGICTKGRALEILSPVDIFTGIGRFLKCVRNRPDLHFLVTPIGCGLAGYQPQQIAALFFSFNLPDNISLPESFWRYRTISLLRKTIAKE